MEKMIKVAFKGLGKDLENYPFVFTAEIDQFIMGRRTLEMRIDKQSPNSNVLVICERIGTGLSVEAYRIPITLRRSDGISHIEYVEHVRGRVEAAVNKIYNHTRFQKWILRREAEKPL